MNKGSGGGAPPPWGYYAATRPPAQEVLVPVALMLVRAPFELGASCCFALVAWAVQALYAALASATSPRLEPACAYAAGLLHTPADGAAVRRDAQWSSYEELAEALREQLGEKEFWKELRALLRKARLPRNCPKRTSETLLQWTRDGWAWWQDWRRRRAEVAAEIAAAAGSGEDQVPAQESQDSKSSDKPAALGKDGGAASENAAASESTAGVASGPAAVAAAAAAAAASPATASPSSEASATKSETKKSSGGGSGLKAGFLNKPPKAK